jgi:hypothetical protein
VSALEPIWLPEVEAEFLRLCSHSRDVGVDVGNQFRQFERLLERGLDPAWRPIDRAGAADIYVMHGNSAICLFAVAGRQMAIVKWAAVGTEYEQGLLRVEAKRRAERLFPAPGV